MKEIQSFLIIIFIAFFYHSTSAQDSFNPWGVSLGLNAVNNPISEFETPQNGLSEIPKYKTWNLDPAGFRFTASRYVKYGFVFEMAMSLNTITQVNEDFEEEFPYLAIDGIFKYNLNPHTEPVRTLNPYLGIGGGYTWVDNIGAGTLNGSVGLNIWVSNTIGFNVQSTYKKAFKEYGISHFLHSAGIVFKFGGIDSDNDGIYDNEDNCPKEFGLVEFNGCPDSDQDGIEDKEDSCPKIAGLKRFNGCPDTDEDGIIDSKDECPNAKGTLQTNGCPDKDGDNVPDKYDKCPEVPGPANNKGCPLPDSDKDGIPDNVDKCPKKAGTARNSGCPEVSKKDETKINTLAGTIFFDFNKSVIREDAKASLDRIVAIMKSYALSRFDIQGHTDNTFGSEQNLILSQNRANAVKEYLVSQGISASRLNTIGFGEERPIATNDTNEGRQKNRRVEIRIIK